MRTYHMSQAGDCAKALSAQHLGYEATPETASSLLIMEESTWHEGRVVQKLEQEGYVVTDRQKELTLEEALFVLQGHIDGVASRAGLSYLLEVKALGRFTFQKYQRDGLMAFPGYAAQVSCYQHMLKLPILLAVKCRDTGQLLETILPDPPMDFYSILDKLLQVEVSVREGELYPATCDEKDKRYCSFRFLCEPSEEKALAKVESLPSLIEAAALWKEGKQLESQAEERLEQAKQAFIAYPQSSQVDKFSVGGVSVSYLGKKSRIYLDEAKLKELLAPEILELARKQGKTWEDVRIRAIKEG